jgi:hypothetical protein
VTGGGGGGGGVGLSEATEKKCGSYTIPSMLLQVGIEILGKKENVTKKSVEYLE